MKLVRLKITDPQGFRSLQTGFEHYFRTEWDLQDEAEAEAKTGPEFAPFICAGSNGSGKSNLLETLAAIFYQLELLRVRREFLPENHPASDVSVAAKQSGRRRTFPDAYELEYLMPVQAQDQTTAKAGQSVHVLVQKVLGKAAELYWTQEFHYPFQLEKGNQATPADRDWLLPQHVLAYSSGENEILSLPFLKMRFIQFDEYFNALTTGKPYPGQPTSRMIYIDPSMSQAMMISHFLVQQNDDEVALRELLAVIGLEQLRSFRIIIKRQVVLTDPLTVQRLQSGEAEEDLRGASKVSFLFPESVDERTDAYSAQLNLTEILERSEYFIDRLKRCTTTSFQDPENGDLYLDFSVDDALKQAFRIHFANALEVFQGLRVLLLLNLYSVGDSLKGELYASESHYVGETIPTLPSDQRAMRFKDVLFSKRGVQTPIMLRSLSDGEHQFLHSLGLALMFRDSRSLFLLDEPETHLNPKWRAKFITSLRRIFHHSPSPTESDLVKDDVVAMPEMLITTHSPFLISDSDKSKVIIFCKNNNSISTKKPDFQTFGTSITKIGMDIFDRDETIGDLSYIKIKSIIENKQNTLTTSLAMLDGSLGDSVEKVMAMQILMKGERE